MPFARSISSKVPKLLTVPRIENRVAVNFWSPGYKIKEIIKDKDGKEKQTSRFYPTTTTEAALSYLMKRYGGEAYIMYKDDIHPGHCSIETRKKYLSAGTRDGLERIGMTTNHPIAYTKDFITEVLSFERFPEKRFDFYTLNIEEVNKIIEILENENNVYSLLGDRPFGFVGGESCATITHRCLRAGGLDELLNVYRSTISYQEILTPARLIDHVEIAQEQEILTNKKIIKPFKDEFHEKSMKLKSELENEINTFKAQQELVTTMEAVQEKKPNP
jgi:hypothetical protein